MFEIGGREEVWSSIFWAQRRGTNVRIRPIETDYSRNGL